MKKYIPSGYQIISIDTTHVDENGILLKETEDEKVLYDLFKTNKIKNKPVLLITDLFTGFAVYQNSVLSLTQLWISEGDILGASLVLEYSSVTDEITVSQQEI